MILVLHGAKKNVGDFLIRERGLALIREIRPSQELRLHPRWEPIDPETLRQADAAVICGGPGLTPYFYPRTYPLVPDLDEVQVPILPLALGWSGQPAEHPERFSFDPPSRKALLHIHRHIGWSAVRDDLSLRVLREADVGDVRRSGCVAWYHLPSLGSTPQLPARVRRFVFTPPAKWRENSLEALRLMGSLRHRYRDAERYCVFHRGLQADAYTGRKEALATRALAVAARALGYRVIDAGYRLDKIDFYGDSDLHVGYRVHAHLCFQSRRRPSVLVCEDGRGLGQLTTFPGQPVLRAGTPDLPGQVHAALDHEERNGHPALHAAVEEIERTFPVMRKTIEQLPA